MNRVVSKKAAAQMILAKLDALEAEVKAGDVDGVSIAKSYSAGAFDGEGVVTNDSLGRVEAALTNLGVDLRNGEG